MLSPILGVLPYWKFGPWTLPVVGLEIHSFGILVAIGVLLGFTYTSWRGENRYGISGEKAQNFCMALLVVGWPLSHVFNVLFYEPQAVMDDPLIILKFWGSISSYGGLFGGLIAFLVWAKLHPELRRIDWAELGTVGIVIPWFFGRIGCATVHDHPGALAPDWPLALAFPERANLSAGPRHDLGFYEAMWWAVLTAVIIFLDRKPRQRGFFCAVLPMLYAPARFAFDFLRVPQALGGDIRYAGLTPAQYFSVALFLFGLIFWFAYVRHQPIRQWEKYEPKSSAPQEEAKGQVD